MKQHTDISPGSTVSPFRPPFRHHAAEVTSTCAQQLSQLVAVGHAVSRLVTICDIYIYIVHVCIYDRNTSMEYRDIMGYNVYIMYL